MKPCAFTASLIQLKSNRFWDNTKLFGPMKDAEIFMVAIKHRDIFGYCSLHQLKSYKQQHKCNLLLVWDFFGHAKNGRDFFGYTDSDVFFFF